MRAVRVVGLALGVLLAGWVGTSCSSPGESPYDAGSLDGFSWTEDGSSPDSVVSPVGADGGDATLSPGTDASPPSSEDGGDSSTTSGDAGTDAGGSFDASDAASRGQDASDASPSPDASDASPGKDANDASPSADASDASRPTDAAMEDASDAPLSDSSDGAPFDATAICIGFNLGGDAISGLGATSSPPGVTLDLSTTDPNKNPVPAADSVVVTATTSPVGVMEDISIGYVTPTSTNAVFVPMSPLTTTGGTNETWQGSIPPIAAGAHVQFWVVGHDYCKANADAGADYYSNNGANYHYETQ